MSDGADGRDTGTEQFVVPLADRRATSLALVGGKGDNLARLVGAGLPVPPGFCVTTDAYRALVETPEIRRAIASLDGLDPGDAEAIAEVSAEIRSKIEQRDLPHAVGRAVEDALDAIGADAYAVRSSATAEDLPTASFAGQHETYLGVTEEAVLDRIGDCLASLFTDRAVSYRLQNDVPNDDVAMAVVVQAMVDADVAGVLFTADPVSGNRHVASVDANYGLGETVVAGEVSPDNARVDRRTGEVLAYEIGEKRHALRANEGGTEPVDVSPQRRETRALSDAQLRALVDLGERVEELLGAPQDVEWALVDGEFVLLQSRPITSLFPLPSPAPDDDRLHVYFNLGYQQAVTEALPPLVVDWWRTVLNRTASRMRSPNADVPFAVEAGNRVYLDLTALLRVGRIRRTILDVLESLSEPAANSLAELLDRRRESGPAGDTIAGIRSLVRGSVRAAVLVAPKVPGAVARFVRPYVLGPSSPEDVRARCEHRGKQLADRLREPPSRAARVSAAFEAIEYWTFPRDIDSISGPRYVAGIRAGDVLERLFPDAERELDALGKGLENELVTRMNQRLGHLADVARQHPDVAQALEDGASLQEIGGVDGGAEFVAAFEAFVDDYGHRASSEIDLSRPRWRDDHETLLGTIRTDLARGEAGEHDEHLDELKRDAEAAAAELEARAGRGLLGPVKRPVVRRLIRAYRRGIQLREHHKHAAAHVFAAAHDVFAEAGESLAANGRLDRPDDVWYLRKDELLAAFEDDVPIDVDVDARRRTHDRYASMSAPPILTSEGETPTTTEDADAGANVLTGTPISAGVVEGTARVVRDPSRESLEDGEILVAPSTDSGWTPLFLNAAGLAMEVGGQMTHGALVAREYGIPAVASVPEATTRIRTGERIRIDGEHGTVELLDRE